MNKKQSSRNLPMNNRDTDAEAIGKSSRSEKESNNSITALIYVSNDEQNIKRAVESAKLLSKSVIVVDIGSTDQSAQIAKTLEVSLLSEKFYPYVELVRMQGIKKVTTDWVFILDSDEVITTELANEVLEKIKNYSDVSAYRVPRKNIFGNTKWLKHGGWWPDHQTRVIRLKDLASWSSVIHSTPVIQGEIRLLKEPLLHYSHGNFSSMVEKTIKFEDTESDLLLKAGKKVAVPTFFRKFFGELYRRLIKNKGFLDGKEGIAESIYQAYSKTITYLLLYEKEKSRSI